MSWTYFPVSTLPTPLDIVWCRFPHHTNLGNPGPYPRPGLVRNTGLDANGNPAVQLVYGTTNLKFEQRKLDFFVTKATEMDACGLYKATRFDLDEVHWLPWADEWFETRQSYTSPIIGHLTEIGNYMLQITLELRRRKQEKAASSRRAKPTKPKKK